MTTYFYNNRQLLILSLVVIFVAGASAYLRLPRQEDPRISNRNPVITTVLPGATAERVETLVTKKIETALRDLSEIKTIESTSSANISSINIELGDFVYDTQSAFTKIRDKITDIRDQLPPEASFPEVDDKRGAAAFTLILGVSWAGDETQSNLNLVNRTAEELADRLRNLSGTDLVRSYGQPKEEITIELDRDHIAELGMTPGEIAARIQGADSKVAAGTIRSNTSDFVIEVAGAFETINRIREIPIVAGARGEVVCVGDVASIRKTWRDPHEEIAYADQHRAIFVAARMKEAEQVASWMNAANTALAEFDNLASDQIRIERVFEQEKYTSQRLGELGMNLLLGSGVVVATR